MKIDYDANMSEDMLRAITGRLFLFIDETGDPGHTDNLDASKYYQVNIVWVDRNSLRHLILEFARFRFFLGADKEIEKYIFRHRDVVKDIFQSLSERNIKFYSFYIYKEEYINCYLEYIGKSKIEFDPKKFKNFIIKSSLEDLFSRNQIVLHQEIELVFDRFLDNEQDEHNFKEYLKNNYKLPKILHIVQVDSAYSDSIQVADILGTLVKTCVFDKRFPIESLNFIEIVNLENPTIERKKKKPGHPQGTSLFPSMFLC